MFVFPVLCFNSYNIVFEAGSSYIVERSFFHSIADSDLTYMYLLLHHNSIFMITKNSYMDSLFFYYDTIYKKKKLIYYQFQKMNVNIGKSYLLVMWVIFLSCMEMVPSG